MTRVADCLRRAAAQLPAEGARIEAEVLLAHALGRSRSWLYAHADDPLEVAAEQRFAALLAQRLRGEPVAHVLGHREFWSLTLSVNADTLIPRPETERLVELALERLPPGQARHVLDLGTGSGAIALAIASERPQARVTAVDASAGALALAQKNAARLGLGRVRFLRGDWYSPVADERFDLIVSNPPYIADDDPHLEQGDLRFEPRTALASGADGLDDIRRIAEVATGHLQPEGWLLVEHGWSQGAAVRALFTVAGLVAVTTATDLEARERVTLGRRAG